MSSTQQGSCNIGRGMNIKAERGTRRTWSQREETVLIAAMKDIVANGWKSDNGFRGGYLIRLQDAMKKEFPNTDLKGSPHIHSKLQSWKKNYNSLTMILSRTGVGFNVNGTHMIDCNDDQWEQIVKVDANARSMRYKSWPMFQDWLDIFGKDRATGDNAEDVMDAANELTSEDNQGKVGTADGVHPHIVKDISVDDIGENSVCSDKGELLKKTSGKGKKRKANEDVGSIVEVIREISCGTHAKLDTIASRISYEYDLDEAKTTAFTLLENISGLTLDEKFEVCEIFADKLERLLIFKGLPENAKPSYVQRLLSSKPK